MTTRLLETPAVIFMIDTALSQLPFVNRYCALMSLCEGMSLREIACVFGISVPEARGLVNDTKKRMLEGWYRNPRWRAWRPYFTRILSVPVMRAYREQEIAKIPEETIERILKQALGGGEQENYEKTPDIGG